MSKVLEAIGDDMKALQKQIEEAPIKPPLGTLFDIPFFASTVVPDVALGIISNSNRATIEASETLFRTKLDEGLAGVERSLNNTPLGVYAMTVNEHRASAGFPPLPDGDVIVEHINCRCTTEPIAPDLGDQALFGRHGRVGSPEHQDARRPLKARKWVSKAAGTVRGGEYGAPGICPYCGESCVSVDGAEPPVHMVCDGEAGVRVGAEGDEDGRAYDRPGYLLRWDHWEQTRTTGRRRPSWRNERAWRTKTREIPSTGVRFFVDGKRIE